MDDLHLQTSIQSQDSSKATLLMDKIVVSDLRYSTKIGVYDWEREISQPVIVNLEIGLPSSKPFASDRLEDALDYAAVVRRVQTLLSAHPYRLVERLAEAIAQVIINEFEAPCVSVSLAKIAPLPGVKAIAVSLTRKIPDTTPQPIGNSTA